MLLLHSRSFSHREGALLGGHYNSSLIGGRKTDLVNFKGATQSLSPFSSREPFYPQGTCALLLNAESHRGQGLLFVEQPAVAHPCRNTMSKPPNVRKSTSSAYS